MTEDRDNKWLEIVRLKMTNYEENPPKDDWESIELSLSKRNKTHKKVIQLRIISAAAAILLIVGMSVIFSFKDANEKTANSTPDKTSINTKRNIADDNTNLMSNADITEPARSNKKPLIKNNVIIRIAVDTTNAVTKQKVAETSTNTIIASNDTSNTKSDKDDKRTTTNHPKNNYIAAVNFKKHNGWNISINASCLAIQVNGDGQNYLESIYYDPASSGSGSGPKIGQTYIELTHHIPIRIGIMIEKKICNNIGLATGVNATYLHSTPKDKQLNNDNDQKIYYIGIPLKINYYFYNKKNCSIYCGSGAEAEKCIYAKRGYERLHIGSIQFSVNTSLGVQYSVNKHLSMYAEPEVSYYWGNGTDIKTFRTENPLSIDIHVGLKLNY